MMVGEIAARYLTGSMALLDIGFHIATHTVALGITAAAYGVARKHAINDADSCGNGKVGDLGGFTSALILGLVSAGIGAVSVIYQSDAGLCRLAEALAWFGGKFQSTGTSTDNYDVVFHCNA